ncbi:MAG: SPFH domain-containing protein [Saprospiraceae bacterium]|nr:SPFH domain-containing protein [Saprospiraceae bacterium]
MFSFLRNNVIDIIEWVEEGNETILWKYPDSDRSIKNGAQLTVLPSQVALFVNEGQIADVYGPGRHVLRTENMPILSQLKGWKYGFESPFKVDVYYVSSRDFLKLRWGTPNPVIVQDTTLGMPVPVRSFGTYVLKVSDAKKFFSKYTGTARQKQIGEIEDDMREIIIAKFTEGLAHFDGNVMMIERNKSEVAKKVEQIVQEELSTWGLSVSKFSITSISMPPEIMEQIQKNLGDVMAHNTQLHKARSTGQEDMNKLNQLAQMDAMKTSAEKGNYENFQMAQNQMMMQQMMMQQMMQNRGGMGGNFQQQQPQQQQPPQEKKMSKEEIMNTLKQLGELKEMGILSDEEFNTKKQELLAKLLG